MNIAIIGAGITGLSAAYYLSLQGHAITIYEAGPEIGGLVGAMKFPHDVYLEKYYHHIFRDDKHVIDLINELGLGDKLTWNASQPGFLYPENRYNFNGIKDLLGFKPLSLIDRFKLGLSIFYFQRQEKWQGFDRLSVAEWYHKFRGDKIYQTVWRPLLCSKFGDDQADNISCAWLWGRIYPRAKSRRKGGEEVGYLSGGFYHLFDKLRQSLTESGQKIYLNTPIKQLIRTADKKITVIDGHNVAATYDKVISTIPVPILKSLTGDKLGGYGSRLRQIKYRSIECAVFILKKPLSDIYWLNNCHPNIDLGGVIEHSNLVGTTDYGHKHIAYAFRYLSFNQNQLADNDQKKRFYLKQLTRIYPNLELTDIEDIHVFYDSFASPIYRRGYINDVPPITTPWPNLLAASIAQIYPDDRTMNNCIRLAKKTIDIMGQTNL